MGRLTFEGDFCDIAMCSETRGGRFCKDGVCSQRKVWERLKYYEDLEEQGRLAVLPCKIGDTVWLVETEPCNRAGCPYQGDYGNWRCKVDGKEQCDPFVYSATFTYAMIGTKFYLTREKAEASLRKRNG